MRFASLGLAAVLLLGAAPLDRWMVEGGVDTAVLNGADGGTGYVLVGGMGTTETIRLRPAPCAASSCTRVAPDAGNEGLPMEDVAACRLAVCGPQLDQTLTSTGTMQAWARDPVLQRWSPMPEKDKSITKTELCQTFPVEPNSMAAAGVRLIYRPVGVGVSGNDGGSLVTSLTCCKMGRKGGCSP